MVKDWTPHPRLSTVSSTDIGALLLAASATILITAPSYLSPWFALSIALSVVGGAVSARIGATGSSSGVLTVVVVFVALSVALGPVAAHFWGSGNVAQSTVFALIVLAGIGFYYGDTRCMWSFLTPVWLIHAGMVIYDGLTHWGYRADGLAANPNVAAGFLVLGIVWLSQKRARQRNEHAHVANPKEEAQGHDRRFLHWLWLLPMLVALPFTQSRLAILVLVLVGLIAYRPKLTVRTVVLTAGAVGIGLALTMSFDRVGPKVLLDDLAARLPLARIPRPWPVGHIDDSDLSSWDTPRVETMHNVPVKLAMELGIGAGLAWTVLTCQALQRRRRFFHRAPERPARGNGGADARTHQEESNLSHFHMLLAVALLSMLDFYPFTVMGWAWWALIRPPSEA